MNDKQVQNSPCKNIFKNGEAVTREEFTQIWIDLINRMEKNKSILAGKV